MDQKQRFILIDGHAILHRAFHALPLLTNSKGQNLGAVYGFCSMLLRVIKDWKPHYLAVAFDLPKPTFRQKIYPQYQAQRPEMAKELVSQIEILHQVLETMQIPVFEEEGYEADDVIGTLTKKIKNSKLKIKNLEVIIVTGDRDMLQLVSDRVKVLAPIVGITKMVLYDKETVEEKYGLNPSQWVDYKALVGDSSDNYPGVSGIGPKTAADLLKRFGTLDKIYHNVDKLSEKQTRVLREGGEPVKLAKILAQIATDVPVDFDLKRCQLKNLKNTKVEKLFNDLEFKSLWERLVKPEGSNNQLSLI